MNPQSYIVATLATSTLIVAGARMARGELPRVRVFIGGTVAAFALTLLAGPMPALARGLATLAILTTALTSGYDLAKALAKLVA